MATQSNPKENMKAQLNQVDAPSVETVGLELEPKEQTTYKCLECYEIYEDRYRANECIFKHARGRYATALLDAGRSLSSIKYACGFHWELEEVHKNITKDNCFVISYWQCCDYPAYRLYSIDGDGQITAGGDGSWSGGYSDKVELRHLTDPRPGSELYRYSETRARRGF